MPGICLPVRPSQIAVAASGVWHTILEQPLLGYNLRSCRVVMDAGRFPSVSEAGSCATLLCCLHFIRAPLGKDFPGEVGVPFSDLYAAFVPRRTARALVFWDLTSSFFSCNLLFPTLGRR